MRYHRLTISSSSGGIRMKNPGIGSMEPSSMAAREADRSLKPGALAEIERSLRGRLRAYDLSDAFIERSLEDALQKGLVEYLRAFDRGEVVDNPAGFIVQAGFCRAIDELRREARQADGGLVDVLIEGGGVVEPSTEEVAMDHLQARELREAVGRLSPEEQQVLRLRYFDGLTNEASAEVLFCSKRTYRRRLREALKKLERHLGAPAPEPGSELAIEIGLASWVALRGAHVAPSQAPLEHLVAMVEGLHARIAWALDRVRELAGRTAGGGGERVLAVAGNGPVKVGSYIAATCLLTAGGIELAHVAQDGGSPVERVGSASVVHQPERKEPLVVVHADPVPAPPRPPESSAPARRSTGSRSQSRESSSEQKEREATEVVASQGPEAAVTEETPEPAPAPAPETSSSSAAPSEVATSQGAEGLVP
jgi:RNA polymerase sigma-70 factor (ECF subfamily)